MGKKVRLFSIFVGMLFGSLMTLPASATIVLSNTRVVYNASDAETSVRLVNNGASPSIVQSWIDDGEINQDPSQLKVPFMLMPPMARVEPGQGQTLRLMYTGEQLPSDRESIYYLNVLEIPPKANAKEGENYVQVALRTRIKLFFRPDRLQGRSIEAPAKMTWSIVEDHGVAYLKASNPTPYHVSMSEVALDANGKLTQVGEGMVAPLQALSLKLNERPSRGARVRLSAIDDFGAVRVVYSDLQP
ncbi:fimbria/pilus periplasmic chaperone [Pseudomonas sp. PA27(2017)]|uniref:fimbria/pilus periplasmic chaperone n=1 Tax=Pseudomonas sp. PA27(2017) TaxID=1932112 RepID=UPI000965B774|nr:fimbria/pilus periplasmic chaperone [Pseudomonas sp. PA27(2017)]OLU36030.1 hypothetical protein BVH06_00890 [Pseudomonas sp. PA27(2017)]